MRSGPRATENLVTRADIAFLEDAEVEAWPSARGQERSHSRLVHADADAVAGGPGLGHLVQSGPDPITVADANLVIRQSLDGEVLAELPVGEIVAVQPLLPVAVRFDLIDEDRPLLSSVAAEVALPVALDVQPPHHARPVHRVLISRWTSMYASTCADRRSSATSVAVAAPPSLHAELWQ